MQITDKVEVFVVVVVRAVDNLGAKDEVMNLVNHGNSDVKMQALLAIQKMMVQNWWVWQINGCGHRRVFNIGVQTWPS